MLCRCARTGQRQPRIGPSRRRQSVGSFGAAAAITAAQSQDKYASRPVSRVLYGMSPAMTIPLGRPSLGVSSNQPGQRRGNAPAAALRRAACRPYSVLLPAGFAVPPLLPGARCALTAPFHPCLGASPAAVCFLWHCPWGCPRRTLSGAVFSMEPGLSSAGRARSGHPADWRNEIRRSEPAPSSAAAMAEKSCCRQC